MGKRTIVRKWEKEQQFGTGKQTNYSSGMGKRTIVRKWIKNNSSEIDEKTIVRK